MTPNELELLKSLFKSTSAFTPDPGLPVPPLPTGSTFIARDERLHQVADLIEDAIEQVELLDGASLTAATDLLYRALGLLNR